MVKVNEYIRFLRKKKGWTQDKFSNKIGIKRSLVGAYEEGRSDPRLNNLLKMCEIFDISLDNILKNDVSNLLEDDYLKSHDQKVKVLENRDKDLSVLNAVDKQIINRLIATTSSNDTSRAIQACATYHITSPNSIIRCSLLSGVQGLPWKTIFLTISINSPPSALMPTAAVVRRLILEPCLSRS